MTPITPLSPEAAARLAEVARSTPAPAVRDEPADEPKRRPGLAELIEEGRALASSIATAERVSLIGSAAYLNNPSDIDFAVLVPGDCFSVAAELAGSGWASCGDYDTSAGDWCAVRRDQFNFMITHRPSFFDGYVTAMEVCKALRLEHKEDRIAVCQIVRDGMKADQVVTRQRQLEAEAEIRKMLGIDPPGDPSRDAPRLTRDELDAICATARVEAEKNWPDGKNYVHLVSEGVESAVRKLCGVAP